MTIGKKDNNVTALVGDDLMNRIKDYACDNTEGNISQAVRKLLEKALTPEKDGKK